MGTTRVHQKLDIEAVLTLPKSRPAQKLPLIVMPHGGPAARDTVSWDWWAQFLADKGYDADWFRDALAERKITACIPSRANRKVAIPHDPVVYKKRHKIENMFGRLKDWRRIHTRYDRCAHTFFSSICIAAAVIFWL